MTAALAVAVLAGCFFGLALARAAGRPDPVDEAYHTLPAGRREPLRVDTATGSHDRYPHMTDNVRDIVIAYYEGMRQHTTNGDVK